MHTNTITACNGYEPIIACDGYEPIIVCNAMATNQEEDVESENNGTHGQHSKHHCKHLGLQTTGEKKKKTMFDSIRKAIPRAFTWQKSTSEGHGDDIVSRDRNRLISEASQGRTPVGTAVGGTAVA